MRELLGNLRFSLDDFGGMRNLAVGNVRGFQLTGALGAINATIQHSSPSYLATNRAVRGTLAFDPTMALSLVT
jgi:hypothetical protein